VTTASSCRRRMRSRLRFYDGAMNWRGDCRKTHQDDRHYKELLDDKTIDAILIAVPDTGTNKSSWTAWARQGCVLRKPMSHSARTVAMVAAAKKTDRIVQIGAQRTILSCAPKPKSFSQMGYRRAKPCRRQPGPQRSTGPGNIRPADCPLKTWIGYVARNCSQEAV